MYQNAAILAGLALIYSAIAGRIERSWVSGPMVFVTAGVILGPVGLNVLRLNIAAEGLRVLAEATLAMVLFTDAASADLAVIRRSIGIPERLLLIGLPLTIVLGLVIARGLLPWLALPEAALLATVLAPTDAALGAPVIANTAVPAPVRESLNLESGLNDGICVPVVVILLGLAVGTQIEGGTAMHVSLVVAEEIGIGLVTGLVLTFLATGLLRGTRTLGWLEARWDGVAVVATAGACFAAAQAAGGSGFIACFVGGLLSGALRRSDSPVSLHGAQSTGETLALLTWVVFGAGVAGQMAARITWPVLIYAVLSLTVIRMLPVFVCLTGSPIAARGKLFIGWFGPRGLASVVLGIMILDANLPGNDTVAEAIVATVILSIICHGITANPLARVLGSGLPGATAVQRPRSESSRANGDAL